MKQELPAWENLSQDVQKTANPEKVDQKELIREAIKSIGDASEKIRERVEELKNRN